MTPALVIVLILCLAAEFTNGMTDAPNAIATVVSTRVLSPGKAVIMAAVLNLLGVLLTGSAVAVTIGKGIVVPDMINLATVAAALLTVIVWTMVAWYYGIPTSETHELVAGMAGAALATAGPAALIGAGWQKVLIGLGLATVVGFGLAYVVMLIIYWLFRKAGPTTVKKTFGKLQIVSAAFMAFSHGSNDGQKFMGAFALALYLGGVLPTFPAIPIWVILLSAAVMGIGTSVGGWRIIRTMGFKMTKLEPVHGFAAETAASAAILMASRLGIPLSTTHTISTAIMGVGSTKRFSAVRWGVTMQIVTTWLVTFPVCGILGYIFASLFKAIF